MAVRLGKISLPGAQNLYTEEARTLVEQRVPEQQGSVFQDMGREPINLVLEGLLLGEQAFEQMEQLRQAQAKASPLPFAADIVIGSELTDVVIESFEARQVAGYANRIRFSMRLREHIEEPVKSNADTASINEAAKQEAKQWEEGSLATADVVENPASLSDKLAKNPALVEKLDMDDVGASITRNIDKLEPEQLGGIVTSIANVNPQKGADLLNGIQKSGGFSGFIDKISEVWDQVKDGIKKIDFSKLTELGKLISSGGLDYLKLFKEVGSKAIDISEEIVKLVGSKGLVFNDLRKLFENKKLESISNILKNFLEKISQILSHEITKKIAEILSDAGLKEFLIKKISFIIEVFKKIENFIKLISLIDIFITSYKVILDFTGEASSGLKDFFKEFLYLIDESSNSVVGNRVDGVLSMVNSIKNEVGFLLDKSEDFLMQSGFYKILEVGKGLQLVSIGFDNLLVKSISDSHINKTQLTA